LCVAALTVGRGRKLSLDCITRAPQDAATVRSAVDALSEFLQEARAYNYAR
jgi:hypothetical protein